jgi:hypothetical protein
MTEGRPPVGFAAAVDAGTERSYQKEIAALDSLPPAEAVAKARKIIRSLSYSAYQYSYGTTDMAERFARLWETAFPDHVSENVSTTGSKKGRTT